MSPVNLALAVVQLRRYDPTQTTAIRRSYEAACVRRMGSVRRAVREAVVDRDVFGLGSRAAGPVTLQAPPPDFAAFDFPTDSAKVQEFDRWFRGSSTRTSWTWRTSRRRSAPRARP